MFAQQLIEAVFATPPSVSVLPQVKQGSLWRGAAGVAFFLHETARIQGRPELARRGLDWCDISDSWNTRNSEDFGFVMGAAGAAYARTLLGSLIEDASSMRAGVHAFEYCWARLRNTGATEMWSGAAGMVCAARDLLCRLPGLASDQRERLRHVGADAQARLLDKLQEPCRTGVRPLGFAHGLAGEIFAALTWDPSSTSLRAPLDDLSSRASHERGMLLFPSYVDGPALHELSGSLCNGIAGFALLWMAAQSVLGTGDRELVLRSCRSVFMLPGEPSLCCGLSGQALVLRRYARMTCDARFARRARDRTREAALLASQAPAEETFDLWAGKLGVALAVLLQATGDGSFPLFIPPAKAAAS